MSIRIFKSTAFAPITPQRARLAGYEYHAFPLDIDRLLHPSIPAPCNLTIPTLVLDEDDTPYGAEGSAILGLQDHMAGCLFEYKVNTEDGNDIVQGDVSASLVGSTLVTSDQAQTSVTELEMEGLCRCYLQASVGLSVAYNLSQNNSLNLTTEVSLYTDLGALVDTRTDAVSPGTGLTGTFDFTVPSDGYYYILVESYSGVGPTTLTAEYTFDGGPSAVFCTARAAWDDGGGVQYTQCPIPVQFDWDCVFETRQRGGTASLCGEEEYTTPSTPPKKYRILTAAGTLRDCYFPSGDCTGDTYNSAGSETFRTYQGTYIYSPDDCSTDNTLEELSASCEFDGAGCGHPCGTLTIPQNTNGKLPNFVPSFLHTPTITTLPTQITYDSDLTCFSNGGGGGTHHSTGSVTKTLSDEDTEPDAIVRLLSVSPGADWSAWDGSGVYYAQYEERTAGFDFVYTECEYRITGAGLNPGSSYSKVITIMRRPFGTFDPWETMSVDIVTGVADGGGDVLISDAFPNAQGYEYDITCSSCN